jgi:hypothetical protein
MASPDPAFLDAVRASAGRLGISPSDLLTSILYESNGRNVWGGKGGQYLGVIQFNPENQKKYGVTPDQTPAEQMPAVEAYLRDRGLKPGSGLLDTYSTINAGRPGLYGRSDAANGGLPGTVADKVATMAPHRLRANALLGLSGGDAAPAAGVSLPDTAPAAGQFSQQAAAPTAAPAQPVAPTAASASPDPSSALQQFAQTMQQEDQPLEPVSPVQINYPMTAAMRARIARIAAAARGGA